MSSRRARNVALLLRWWQTLRPHRLIAAGLIGVAIWQFGQGGYIFAKAKLAQALIRASWKQARATGEQVPPWPWADTRPVARLIAPRLGVEVYVLAGSSGRTLAFGPGHVAGTPLPGYAGNSVIAAHRDTHFAFLQRLRLGDELIVETVEGLRRSYTMTSAEVAHKSATYVMASDGGSRLTLITCYPFDAITPGGPLRYVVSAIANSPDQLSRAAP